MEVSVEVFFRLKTKLIKLNVAISGGAVGGGLSGGENTLLPFFQCQLKLLKELFETNACLTHFSF